VSWTYSFTGTARAVLRTLDRRAQVQIIRYLDERIARGDDPTLFGKPLRGRQHGYWRYRVGDYRIIACIERAQLQVLVVKVGHRSTVYE
jgi:mRNA interferase RelE/StbE